MRGTCSIIVQFIVLFEAILQASTETFSCLSDSQLIKLEKELLDDDYCDCYNFEANDEPNTSACANLYSSKFVCHTSPISMIPNENSLPLTKRETFFAANTKDYGTHWIFSSQVHDGICDCCDGSDEKGSIRTEVCPNTCTAQLQAHVNKVLKEAETHKKGVQVKEDKVRLVKKAVQEKSKVLSQLQKQYSNEIQKLQSARDQYSYQMGIMKLTELMKHIREIESLVKVNKERKELAPLVGECLSIVSNEKDFKSGSFESVPRDFRFTICPFVNITQVEVVPPSQKDKPKEVVLGYWDSEFKGDFENVWDEEISAKLLYSNGEKCYNGPDRVTEMVLECGEKNEIAEVREDGKCQYKVRLRTPYTCQANYSNTLKEYAEKGTALLSKVFSSYIELTNQKHDEL